MSTEKPSFLSQPVVKNIYVYRNGDPYYEGRRLVINEKKVSSFETFLREVTGGVQAPFGAVRNIYTPRAGHRVSCMQHIQSGQRYVAAGSEKFKKLDYSEIGTKKKRLLQNNGVMIKQVAQSRIAASARFLKPIKEPCLIFVVANGDVLNPPVRLLIPQRMLGLFERVLEMITEKMNLRIMGGVRSLYMLDGTLVSDGNDLESGQYYVAVGRERFKKLPYTDLIFAKPASMRRFVGSKAASLPPIYRAKKQDGPVGSDQSKSMGATNGASDSKMGSPKQGNEAQLMKLRQRKSILTMSLGAQDNDEGDQREEEGAANPDANQDNGPEAPLPSEEIKGESEIGTEESAGGNDDREEDVTIPGAGELEEEEDGATAADDEREEESDTVDTWPLVNGNGEMNEGEEEVERSEREADNPTPGVNGNGEMNEGEEEAEQSEREADNPTPGVNGNEVDGEEEDDRAEDCGAETANDPSPEMEDKQAEEELVGGDEKEEGEAGDGEQENGELEAKHNTNEGEETQEVRSAEEADPGGAPERE
ncbi:doublecortin domain-containing protein 2-like isoform X2 [Brienomyrus brachyistius]|uniref:doublecortin domain-containing protein 2-like isoform X2 n=1 Tax=Brienomyrus brachyistius TaxID=42636 RepID=UPI0020B3AF74|nr:doublecortin domain-containing protein 2-like isoform X2 [Brienomyrus brachyistius]